MDISQAKDDALPDMDAETRDTEGSESPPPKKRRGKKGKKRRNKNPEIES